MNAQMGDAAFSQTIGALLGRSVVETAFLIGGHVCALFTLHAQMKAEEFLKAQNAAQMLDNAPSKRGEGTGVGGIGGEGSMLEDMKRQIATNSNKAKRPTSKI